MRQKGKRKIIKTIPKKKYVQKPPHKGTFWSEYSFAIIAFFFMVFVSFLLYYSSLPENYDKETVGNIVRHELKYDMTQGRMGGSVSYSFVVYYQYMVGGDHYSSKVSLGYTRQNIPFIKKIKDYGSMYPVTVTYDSHNPQISTIVVE